jgi:uncharacterized protein YdeI (YjbR/CyaY-like superfamily)
LPELTARDAAEWAAWLDEHHTSEAEVWLVYYKKGTGKQSVAWAEAVEVALRFGWIDGLISTIDDERYKQRWTPRRARSKWSLVNKQICERLIAAGEMRWGSRLSRRQRQAASGIVPTRCSGPRRHHLTSAKH